MFRFFRYIALFLLGYKVLKMLFADDNQQQRVSTTPPRQNINNNNQQQQNTSPNNSKFSDAEFIDFEEVK